MFPALERSPVLKLAGYEPPIVETPSTDTSLAPEGNVGGMFINEKRSRLRLIAPAIQPATPNRCSASTIAPRHPAL